MLNSTILSNNIIQYKNDNLNNPNYKGFEIYKELIPKYIFDNVIITGNFTNTVPATIPNIIAIKETFLELSLSAHYPTLEAFTSDFESKILTSMTFTTPAGSGSLTSLSSGILSNNLNSKMRTLTNHSYENIVTEFSQIIVDWIINNTFLNISSVSGNYIPVSIQ